MDTAATTPRFRVALDAMGGDYGPTETVPGALTAAASGGVDVLLVGDADALREEMARHPSPDPHVVIVPAEGLIAESESPLQAMREKPRASILVATGLVKEGKADAAVTMGSTGAAMIAASIGLGLIEGIDRPALGGPIIGFAPNMVLLDLGSNMDCRPSQLVDFGALGVAFASAYLNVTEPRVALLSVGAEASKGNRQTRETAAAFGQSGLNFVGNIEGHDLAAGKAEVVVCDGFVGNILMKTVEGLGDALIPHLRSRLKGVLSEAELSTVCDETYDLFNVGERSGGGPLFGVNGMVVVGHGRFRAQAIADAAQTARRLTEVDLLGHMRAELERVRARAGSQPRAGTSDADARRTG